jgi:hypothetical protein
MAATTMASSSAPCTNWQQCGRRYDVVEFDTAQSPWRQIKRIHVLDISAEGATWIKPFDSRDASRHGA